MENKTIYGITSTLRSESDGSLRSHTMRYLAASSDEAARAAARYVRFLTLGSSTFPYSDDLSTPKASLVECQVFCEILGEVYEDGDIGTLILKPFLVFTPSEARYIPQGMYLRSKGAYRLSSPGGFSDFVEAFVANEVIEGSVAIPMSELQSA